VELAVLFEKIPGRKSPTSVKWLTDPPQRILFKLTCLGDGQRAANSNLTRTAVSLTREQHVERSKERALALLNVGRIREAVASMMMDMRKYPNCEVPHEIHAIGIFAAAAGDVAVAGAYIEGFN
jgi:hypothetical protein